MMTDDPQENERSVGVAGNLAGADFEGL